MLAMSYLKKSDGFRTEPFSRIKFTSKEILPEMANQASLIPEKHARVVLSDVETPTPIDGQVLVKVDVIGFNPIEAKNQK